MRQVKRQKGMSAISLIFMLVLLGFVGLFIGMLVPSYIEYFNVKSTLQGMNSDGTQYATTKDVEDAIKRRFNINDVKSINASDVLVEPAPGGYSLHVDYEARVPFISNVTLVAKFACDGQARGGSGAP